MNAAAWPVGQLGQMGKGMGQKEEEMQKNTCAYLQFSLFVHIDMLHIETSRQIFHIYLTKQKCYYSSPLQEKQHLGCLRLGFTQSEALLFLLSKMFIAIKTIG